MKLLMKTGLYMSERKISVHSFQQYLKISILVLSKTLIMTGLPLSLMDAALKILHHSFRKTQSFFMNLNSQNN